MTRYPLIFGLRDIVDGNGFRASVVVDGRALLHQDDGEFWVEGVNPGGFAGSGATSGEALREFRLSYTAILFDIASESTSFEDFRGKVQEFYGASAETPVREWEAAVAEVRSGRVSADWLTRRPADSARGVKVRALAIPPTPKNNQLVVEAGAALAA